MEVALSSRNLYTLYNFFLIVAPLLCYVDINVRYLFKIIGYEKYY